MVPPLDVAQLEQYLGVLKTYGAMMIVHAEDAAAIERGPQVQGRRYASFLASRPRGSRSECTPRSRTLPGRRAV